MKLFNDLTHRLRVSWGWLAAQFWATLLLVLAGLAWTRLPDKHVWQVLLSLVVPLLLAAGFFVLEAGTMRRLFDQNDRRARFWIGALTLVAWALVWWAAWAVLNWCGDQTSVWAGYLNSKAPARLRAKLLTYDHIESWLTILVWIWRWIVLPGKIVPHAIASAQWGWKLPWRRLWRLLLNWRWWPVPIVAALLGVALPAHFFAGLPQGTVSHQVWAVVLKVGGSYLLILLSWVALLAWAAVLVNRQPEPAKDTWDGKLFQTALAGRWWLGGVLLWALFGGGAVFTEAKLASKLTWYGTLDTIIGIVLVLALVVLQCGYLRSMIAPGGKRVRMVWGFLMMLAWAVPMLGIPIVLSIYDRPAALVHLTLFVSFGALFPFAAASAQWGWRLPWRGVLKVLAAWDWWAVLFGAVVFGLAVPVLLLPSTDGGSGAPPEELHMLRTILADILRFGSWILFSAWTAVLLNRSGSARELLAEGGDNPGGNA